MTPHCPAHVCQTDSALAVSRLAFRILIHRTSKGCSALGTASLSPLPSTTQSISTNPAPGRSRSRDIQATLRPPSPTCIVYSARTAILTACNLPGTHRPGSCLVARSKTSSRRSFCLAICLPAFLVSPATDHADRPAAAQHTFRTSPWLRLTTSPTTNGTNNQILPNSPTQRTWAAPETGNQSPRLQHSWNNFSCRPKTTIDDTSRWRPSTRPRTLSDLPYSPNYYAPAAAPATAPLSLIFKEPGPASRRV